MKKALFSILLILASVQFANAQVDELTIATYETKLIEPVEIIKVSEGHYFIDFGKAYFGTVSMVSEHSQADTLIVHLAEELSQEHAVNRKPKGTIRYQKSLVSGLEKGIQTEVRLTPDKRNTNKKAIQLPDSFGIIMPFRYCEIENLKVPIDGLKISQKAIHYSFDDEASAFHSSDTVLDQIWDLCKHTIKATSFAGYYVDGDRERIPYEADAYINQLSHYAVDSEYSLARRTNEFFITNPTWPTEWILHTAKMFYYDYLYTGDTKSIEKYYEKLQDKALLELAREDGLITTHTKKLDNELMRQIGFKKTKKKLTDIVDWPLQERDGYEFKAINTVVNSFYYENLHFMSLIAEAVGNKKDAKFYKAEALRVKGVINDKLFDASRGIYVDGEGSDHASLHANMMPLAFGLVEEENLSTVTEYVKSKGMACSVYGAQYLLEGLYNNNEAAYAKQLIVDTTHVRTWWNMIKIGSTMALEAWDIEFKSNLDWNHAWGTAPANIITRNMWGIIPVTPGFTRAEIAPQLEGFEFSEITVPTIKGAINASFKTSEDGTKTFEIEMPKTIKGKFVVPTGEYESVALNGKVLRNKTAVKLKKGLNIIELQ